VEAEGNARPKLLREIEDPALNRRNEDGRRNSE